MNINCNRLLKIAIIGPSDPFIGSRSSAPWSAPLSYGCGSSGSSQAHVLSSTLHTIPHTSISISYCFIKCCNKFIAMLASLTNNKTIVNVLTSDSDGADGDDSGNNASHATCLTRTLPYGVCLHHGPRHIVHSAIPLWFEHVLFIVYPCGNRMF